MKEKLGDILGAVWFALIVIPYLLWQVVATVQLARYLWKMRHMKSGLKAMATESVG